MISKKLLNEVLNIKVINFEKDLEGEFNPCLQIEYNNGCMLLLNLYELAYLCKKWALKKGFNILTNLNAYYIKTNESFDLKFDFKIEKLKDNYYIYASGNYNTENEAIFKACEWLIKNKY